MDVPDGRLAAYLSNRVVAKIPDRITNDGHVRQTHATRRLYSPRCFVVKIPIQLISSDDSLWKSHLIKLLPFLSTHAQNVRRCRGFGERLWPLV